MHSGIEVQMRCWFLGSEFEAVGERLKLNNATYISGRLDLVIQAAEIGTSFGVVDRIQNTTHNMNAIKAHAIL